MACQAAFVLMVAGRIRLAFRVPLLAIGCGLVAAAAIEGLRRLGLAWPLMLGLGGLGYAALLVAAGVARPHEWLLTLQGRSDAVGLAGRPQA